jgi:hypothetical protein
MKKVTEKDFPILWKYRRLRCPSLITIVSRKKDHLIIHGRRFDQTINHDQSGFYLHNHDELIRNLIALDQSGQNVILIGVTYA